MQFTSEIFTVLSHLSGALTVGFHELHHYQLTETKSGTVDASIVSLHSFSLTHSVPKHFSFYLSLILSHELFVFFFSQTLSFPSCHLSFCYVFIWSSRAPSVRDTVARAKKHLVVMFKWILLKLIFFSG